jgi:hypothetical protein
MTSRARVLFLAASIVVLASVLSGPTASAQTPAAAGPWGPAHRVVAEVVRRDVQVATSDQGLSVVAWEARVTPGAWAVHAAVRSWGATADGGRPARC